MLSLRHRILCSFISAFLKQNQANKHQANKKCPSPIKIKKASKQASFPVHLLLWTTSGSSQGNELVSSVPHSGADQR